MKLRHIGGLLVALGTLSIATANAEERAVKLAGLDVTVWSPKSDDVSGLPVIVFSHGFHGCATQSRFLMEAFASAGYLVLAPNHRDATCNGGPAHWWNKAQAPFRKPEDWNDATFRDRGDDVRRLIEAARSDDRFRPADWSRIGLAGHSLGGYTVLALAGAWPQWKLDGVTGYTGFLNHQLDTLQLLVGNDDIIVEWAEVLRRQQGRDSLYIEKVQFTVSRPTAIN
jgi:predicted dienelactone hydrolase